MGAWAFPSYVFCDLVGCEAVASAVGILILNTWRSSINSPTTCSQIFYQGHFGSTGKAAMVQWKLSLLEVSDSWRLAGDKATGSQTRPQNCSKHWDKSLSNPSCKSLLITFFIFTPLLLSFPFAVFHKTKLNLCSLKCSSRLTVISRERSLLTDSLF